MKARLAYPLWLRWGVTLPALALFALHCLFPVPLERLDRVSTEVVDQDGQWLAGFTVDDGRWRLKAHLEQIDPVFVERLIRIEDKRFYSHGGVDPIAIVRAAKSWAREGQPVSGASTLTMQLARQIEPRPRTLRSKAVEAFRAIQLELALSKDEILEYYLTHISYGGNLEGVRAASLSYYGYEPEALTDSQISMLIALPQAPEARRPDRRPQAAKSGRDIITEKLYRAGLLSRAQADEAIETPAGASREPLPQMAWLAAQRLAQSGEPRVRSTIDKALQVQAESRAQAMIAAQPEIGNIAILIVHNPSRDVRASVGSASRDLPGGWIDMTRAQRSPGSTLKPFVYGMAFDAGIAAPGTRLQDAPTRFGSYRPENFTRRYYGDVSVSEALQHSLNVPAVLTLDKIGAQRFESHLRSSGISISRPVKGKDKGAGLAVALGGLGMSPEGLATLYSGLANGGQVAPLRWTQDAPPSDDVFALLSPVSAAHITQILQNAPTPDGHVPPWLAGNAPPIAYKTGTSYGHRDAWAAGYTQEWTVIVWMGRADGAPRFGLTGRDGALPVLFDMFAALDHSAYDAQFARQPDAPEGLAELSGKADKAITILFPPENAELFVPVFGSSGDGVPLSVQDPKGQDVSWYVDAKPLKGARWHPDGPGYFKLVAVSADGRSVSVRVNVMSGGANGG